MRLLETEGQHRLRVNKNEWVKIGQQANWQSKLEEAGEYGYVPNIEVSKYTDRLWRVDLGGELVCVTVYKRGAESVRELIEVILSKLQSKQTHELAQKLTAGTRSAQRTIYADHNMEVRFLNDSVVGLFMHGHLEAVLCFLTEEPDLPAILEGLLCKLKEYDQVMGREQQRG